MNPNLKISDTLAFNLEAIKPLSNNILGYYLTSTATIHVEDTPDKPTKKLVDDELTKIAKHLINTNNPQLTISIHGYANKKSDSISRSNKIYKYATQNQNISQSKNVFIGYRWPAENIIKDDPDLDNHKGNSLGNKVKFALEALPTLLLGILISTLVLGIVTVTLLFFQPTQANLVVTFLSIVLFSGASGFWLIKLGNASRVLHIFPNGVILLFCAALIGAIATHQISLPINSNSLLLVMAVFYVLFFGTILTLIALKLVTYPGDRYRATNYAVIDLVEFIKQIERAVIKELCIQAKIPDEECFKIRKIEDLKDKSIKINRIRISFINHSLGCEVVTQTIRILSDVFDPDLRNEGEPSSNIGSVFSLGRIVLVAPDIPLESILSSRSNFLKSALRRCEEAYVFSNEADLALRLASTAANYFSFPSKTRFRGYKLGNVTVKHFVNQDDSRKYQLDKDKNYGILKSENDQDKQPHKNLEIRASNIEHRTIDELLKIKKEEKTTPKEETAIADLLTYFDCTDYVDFEGNPVDLDPTDKKPKGILSHALGKSALNLWFDYIFVSIAFFTGIPRRIDVHGGYFQGKFSQKLIYNLAFLGYKESINSDFNDSTDAFSQVCRHKGIQVLLASKPLPNAPIGESPSQYR
jgi:hypothetical protein